jgi:class 3 adenylate cyclase
MPTAFWSTSLVGFTDLNQELAPERTVDFLGRIFSTFDRLAAEVGVEKIKTIGDGYMAAAGVPEMQRDHAARIAALAPRMLSAVADIAEAVGLTLAARVGMYTGPIVAGVIGTHKFVYDVRGDTVNTASPFTAGSYSAFSGNACCIRRCFRDRTTRRDPNQRALWRRFFSVLSAPRGSFSSEGLRYLVCRSFRAPSSLRLATHRDMRVSPDARSRRIRK